MIRIRNIFMSVTSLEDDLKKEIARKLKISEKLIR